MILVKKLGYLTGERADIMSIARLSLVNIMGDMKCLDDVIIRCSERGDFHPELPIQSLEGIHGFAPLTEENPYAELLARMADLGMQAGIKPRYMPEQVTGQALALITQDKAQYYSEYCISFQKELAALQEKKNFLQSEVDQDEGALVYLSHLAQLDVDFDAIFSCQYTKVRFGRLPLDSYKKLSFYGEKPFLFAAFDTEKDYCWGAYFALKDDMPEIDDIFSSLYFERMRVPVFLHGTPEEELSKLKQQLAQTRRGLELVQLDLEKLASSKAEQFHTIYTRIKFLTDSFEMRKYVSVLKREFVDIFYIAGFIEEEHAQAFAQSVGGFEGVTVEIKPHDSDKRLKPPTKLKNNRFVKPFEMFVEMYGLPGYGDVDPTPFVAFTYCLLFGIMFGDLGQGLLLVIVGQLAWRWKRMNLGRIISRIGIFSAAFGTLYGSVFGLEHLLDPVYTALFGLHEKPIEIMAPEMTNVVLIGAVALGVVLICTSILINIYVAFKKRDLERALFSCNGIAGLLFYGSVLFGAVMFFITGKNGFTVPYVLCLIVLPLAVILFKEPLGKLAKGLSMKQAKPHDGMGAYLTEGAFELFEVVLSFFSNTMSFLRVGGFVLSHAGMMAVVFTLSEMVGSASSAFVIVIGNLFVIAMEGLIVGIQVLRLEFYEMFSRYFDGDGKPFQPIQIAAKEDRA